MIPSDRVHTGLLTTPPNDRRDDVAKVLVLITFCPSCAYSLAKVRCFIIAAANKEVSVLTEISLYDFLQLNTLAAHHHLVNCGLTVSTSIASLDEIPTGSHAHGLEHCFKGVLSSREDSPCVEQDRAPSMTWSASRFQHIRYPHPFHVLIIRPSDSSLSMKRAVRKASVQVIKGQGDEMGTPFSPLDSFNQAKRRTAPCSQVPFLRERRKKSSNPWTTSSSIALRVLLII